MKGWICSVTTILCLALVFFLASSAVAQAQKVTITYAGDSEKTIARRAQWIEGAKKEGKFVWWGTLSTKEQSQIIAAFKKIYPFIEGDHLRGGSDEITAKLEGEYAGGVHTADIALGTNPINLPRWRKMGMLEPFADIVPGIGKIDNKMYSKHGDWMVPGSTVVIPQYNTKLVSAAEAPKSWEDLLNPKWRGGQIAVPSTGIKEWAGLAAAEGGWGVEKTENFLKKLRAQGLRYGGPYAGTHALLEAGEFKVEAQGLLYRAFLSQRKGAPIEWSRVDPVLVAGGSFILIKNGRHPNASRLFLEWLFSPQGMVAWEKVTLKGAAYPGAGTQQSKALEGLNLVYQTEETDIKIAELGLMDKFAKILGMTP